MPFAPFPKTCERCGETYTTRAKAQRFCSHRCAALATHPGPVPARRRIPRDRELLHGLYVEEGESTVTLAERFGVKPFSVNRVLGELDIPRRTKRTDADLRRVALGKQRAARMSKHEAALASALTTRGHAVVPQYAVSKYNIDIAFPGARLAIEVDGGQWHQTERKRASDKPKTAYLIAQGWRELRFSTSRPDWIDTAIDTIEAALANQHRRLAV